MIAGLEPWAQEAVRAGVGLTTGVLVGIERGFNLRGQKEGTRVAGVRTFSLLGLGAGVAGLFSESQPFAAGAILIAMLAYLAIAYARKLQPSHQLRNRRRTMVRSSLLHRSVPRMFT